MTGLRVTYIKLFSKAVIKLPKLIQPRKFIYYPLVTQCYSVDSGVGLEGKTFRLKQIENYVSVKV
jgi:hypothetical protein